MSTILAIAAAKFLDPLLFIAALIGAYPIRRWRGILILGAVLGLLYELFLLGIVPGGAAMPLALSVVPAWIAATAHAGLAFCLYRFFRKRNAIAK